MESKGLQELVKKVFGDTVTKAEFEKDPESVTAHFQLTDLERKAVLSTATGPGVDVDPLILWNSPVP
jgi:hypothetical protein